MKLRPFLEQSEVILKGVLLGATLGILISQYDGRIDFQLDSSGVYISIDGNRQEQCILKRSE